MKQTITPQDMLTKLVSFNTVSDRSNLELIAYVEAYLNAFGIETFRVPDATGNKSSLHATIGPRVDGGVVLSAHTDVVPVEGQDWSSDPFTARIADGRLYARGAADMKGFAATALAKIPDFLSADLKKPIHLALSYDEEVGCFGAPPLIEHLLENGPRPDFVIVGEPTNMKVATAHKGIAVIKTTVHGHPVHSSQLHHGVSAISVAAKLISWLDAKTAENRARSESDSLFDPPYTTLHCGMIGGGKAINITAQRCEFSTDIRTMPGETSAQWIDAYKSFIELEILPEMRLVSEDCHIEVEMIANVPGLQEEADGKAETIVRHLTGDNLKKVLVFASEGGIFQNNGLSTVICGPGSIDQAHQPDEFIDLSELDKCAAFFDKLTDFLSR